MSKWMIPSYCSIYNKVICIRLNCWSNNVSIYLIVLGRNQPNPFPSSLCSPNNQKLMNSFTPLIHGPSPSHTVSHKIQFLFQTRNALTLMNHIAPNMKHLHKFQNHYLTLIDPIKPNLILQSFCVPLEHHQIFA